LRLDFSVNQKVWIQEIQNYVFLRKNIDEEKNFFLERRNGKKVRFKRKSIDEKGKQKKLLDKICQKILFQKKKINNKS